MSALNGSGRHVVLADGDHVVRFTVNNLIEVEEHFETLPAMFEALAAHKLRTARALLWLSGTAPTLEAAGDLLEGVTLDPVVVVLAEALADSLASLRGAEAEAADQGEVGPTTEIDPTTGPISSPSV